MAHHHKVIGAAQDGGSDKHEGYVGKSQCSCKEDETPEPGQDQRFPDREMQQEGVHENLDLPVDHQFKQSTSS